MVLLNQIYDNVDLQFTDGAIKEIAKIAVKKGTGARGLRSVVEKFMNQIMYEISDHNGETVLINENIVRGGDFTFLKEVA